MATILISKADFLAANLVKFSPNIAEDQLAPYVYAAQEYELEPKLGADLYADLVAYAESPDAAPRPMAPSRFVNRVSSTPTVCRTDATPMGRAAPAPADPPIGGSCSDTAPCAP